MINRKKDFKNAEPLLKQEGKIMNAYHGAFSLPHAKSVLRLANMYKLQGKNSEALQKYQYAIGLFEKVLGKKNKFNDEIIAHIAEIKDSEK